MQNIRPALFLAIITGLAPGAQAAESLYARVASIGGADWSIKDLEVLIDLRGAVPAGNLRIATIDLPAMEVSLPETQVRCGRLKIAPDSFGCLDARFSVELAGIGRGEFSGKVEYDRRNGTATLELRRIPLAGGNVDVSGKVTEDDADLVFSGDGIAIDQLAVLIGHLDPAVASWSAAGSVAVSGNVRARAGGAARVVVKAELHDASVSNEAGTIVTASARGSIGLDATRRADGWEFAVELTADAGEAYVEPVYVNLAEGAVAFSAAGTASETFDTFDLSRYSLQLGSTIDAHGDLRFDMPVSDDDELVFSGSVQFVEASFETLYKSLLQVFAAGTLFGDLETAGTISGVIEFENSAIASADLELHELDADDQQSRFALYGLDGVIHWPGARPDVDEAAPSWLEWQGASAYDIPLGGARIDALLGDDDLELTAPLRIPTMGGALEINRLAVKNYGREDASGLLDAALEPIQLGLLTGAFGWPAFSGTLSGKLPLLQYDGEVVTVGGTLAAHAFDGDIEFANLRLEQPFGLVPRLSGDLRLRQLDLEQLTDTFSFGLIQGRLSGDVTGLEMIAWRPTAMDLHLYTPPGDKSRRRISQRAVEDLASVGGGGAAAALSSGFMSFFDEFSYRKIGLRCVLADGVCRMSGAGPAGESALGQGYYIVQGSGLPRIDVVGYRHEVSWSRLVRQLAQITESGGPTIR